MDSRITGEPATSDQVAAYEAQRIPDPSEWGEPEPIGRTDMPNPYPIDAWPGLAGEAIAEVIESAQVPPALAGHGALCAISTVAMGLADVKRCEGLTGPIGIYALVMCDSGERKSHVDRLLSRGIEEWQVDNEESQRIAFRQHLTQREIWTAKREGLLAKIKRLTERGPNKAEL